MIEYARGDILEADTEAIVNSVNCVGVMGRGLALQVKKAFPETFARYKAVCERGELEPGRVFIHDRGALLPVDGPRYIANVPTKTHWRPPSKVQYIEDGAEALVREVKRLQITSIAVPPLGCGGGGLDWQKVEPVLVAAFEAIPQVRVVLYPPHERAEADAAVPGTDLPPAATLTRGRALLIDGINAGSSVETLHRWTEGHAVAYLLQQGGEPLGLTFRIRPRGPLAGGVDHVLRHLCASGALHGVEEGHTFRIAQDAVHRAASVIATHPDAGQRADRVRTLVSGARVPPETLAMVLWMVSDGSNPPANVRSAIEQIHALGTGTRERFSASDIQAAWGQLGTHGWI